MLILASYPFSIAASFRFGDLAHTSAFLALENVGLFSVIILLTNVFAVDFSPLHCVMLLLTFCR